MLNVKIKVCMKHLGQELDSLSNMKVWYTEIVHFAVLQSIVDAKISTDTKGSVDVSRTYAIDHCEVVYPSKVHYLQEL